MVAYLRKHLKASNAELLKWEDFPSNEEHSCIISSFRDPVSHFISGFGELEIRRKGKKPAALYESFELGSESRFLSFLTSLLDGDVFRAKELDDDINYMGHIYPQSGHLLWLSRVNKKITKLIHKDDINADSTTILKEECGIPYDLPLLSESYLHKKVGGQDALLYGLLDKANKGYATKQITRAFQSICLLNAIDYACLQPDHVPRVCTETFTKHLPT